MNVRKSMISLAVAGVLAAGSAAVAQSGYPGAPPGGGYPGGGGGYPGAASSPGYPGAPGGMGAAAPSGGESITDLTSSTTTGGSLPKSGGDPLTLTLAGSMILGAGAAVRRRFRRA